ncbi:MAG: hypothetical protein KBG28_10780 [Kofleriaceae bacterium]|nr:hypothetical protein [Kofleriaceae bacterium]
MRGPSSYVHCPSCQRAFDLGAGTGCPRCVAQPVASAPAATPPRAATPSPAAVAATRVCYVPVVASVTAAPSAPVTAARACPRARITAATGELLAAISDAGPADLDAVLAEGALVPDAADDPWAALLLSAIVASIAERRGRPTAPLLIAAPAPAAAPPPASSPTPQQAFWLGVLVGLLARVERRFDQVLDLTRRLPLDRLG